MMTFFLLLPKMEKDFIGVKILCIDMYFVTMISCG